MSISHQMRKFYEGDKLLEAFARKEITGEDLDRHIAIATMQAKFLTAEISAHKIAAAGGKAAKMLKDAGLVSSASIPTLVNIRECFPCHEQGDCLITRSDCLDYSGSSQHIDDCQKCLQFTKTRKQICPK